MPKEPLSRSVPRALRPLLPGALLVLLPLLQGCATAKKPVRMVGLLPRSLTLSILIDADANDSSPIAVDVVAVDGKKALAEVSALTSTDWFARRADLQRMRGKNITVLSREWVPGEVVPEVDVPGTTTKDAVLLFAHYSTKGEHRAVLPVAGHVVLRLKAADFALQLPGEPKAGP